MFKVWEGNKNNARNIQWIGRHLEEEQRSKFWHSWCLWCYWTSRWIDPVLIMSVITRHVLCKHYLPLISHCPNITCVFPTCRILTLRWKEWWFDPKTWLGGTALVLSQCRDDWTRATATIFFCKQNDSNNLNFIFHWSQSCHSCLVPHMWLNAALLSMSDTQHTSGIHLFETCLD